MGNKGYIYIIEVLLAIGLMLGAVIFVFGTSTDVPDFSNVIIGQTGLDALSYLEERGILRQLVYEKKEAEIESALSPLISENIGYEAEVCSPTCATINITGTQTIVTVDYFISGYRDNYVGRKVRLFMWGRY